MQDESPIGIYLWFVLIALISGEWIGMDIWLHSNGHEMLTTEFREGLAHPLWGPVLAFAVTGTISAFVWHMLHDN